MERYRYNLGLAFAHVASTFAERPALICADRSLVQYRELDLLSNRAAAVLAGRGFRRRDVVAIVHDKSPICYAMMLGALKLGVTYVNVDDQNPPARLAHILGS